MKCEWKRLLGLVAAAAMLAGILPGGAVCAAEPENLCIGATVLRSKPGNTTNAGTGQVANMFDGDATNRYTSYSNQTEGEYVLDLGSKKDFNQVVLYKGDGYKGEFDFAVEYSADDQEYKTALSAVTTPDKAKEALAYDFTAVNGRYVKFKISNIKTRDNRIDISDIQLYNILDTTPPEITLLGEEKIMLELGDSYTEPGYTAKDDRDGDLTEAVVVGGDAVNTQQQGIYRVTYDVSDKAGNAAEQKIRIVSVGIDGIPPVITLKGSAVMEVGRGDIFVDPGYTATDNKDGDLTEAVVVSGDTVDTETVGTYTIRYDVTDQAGNAAQTVTRTVSVAASLYNTDICIDAELVTDDSRGSQETKVSNMFDGDKTTRYRSWQRKEGCTGEHILDLGASKQFNQVVVIQSNDSARLFTLTVQAGETADGPWSNVTDPIDVPKADGGETVRNFAPVRAQYVRFYIDKVEPGQDFYNIAELQLFMDEASYKISQDLAALTLPSKTGVGLTLPSVGMYGSLITWKSSDASVMDASGKLTGRPTALEGEKTVHLTATLTFNQTVQNAEFDVTVVPQNLAESAKLSGIEHAAALNDADYTTVSVLTDKSEAEVTFSTAELLSRAEFVLQGKNHLTAIEVFAWNDGGYTSLGVCTPTETEDGIWTVEFLRGEYEKLKFRFSASGATTAAELLLGLTDRDAVEYLAEKLTVSDEPLSRITKDLILQSRGEAGQTITWSSSNTAVVRNNGTVLRPSSNTDVRITAVITKGGVSESVDFDITVLQKEANAIGITGGGSGGGGGIGGGISVPKTEPAELPEVTQPDTEQSGGAMKDMDASHWAYSYVEALVKAGIVSGDENGNFEPERTVTRAEYIKMLATAFAVTGEAEAFEDVPADAWYRPYIAAARANGIMQGDERNRALPETEISRQDMAVMLGRVMEVKAIAFAQNRDYQGFADQDAIGDYAAEYVRLMYCGGIIDGIGDSAFAPLNFATRAQAAKIIAVALKGV